MDLRRDVYKAVGITKLASFMMTRWVYWGIGSLAVVIAEVFSLVPLPAVRVPSRDAVTGRCGRIVPKQGPSGLFCPLIESALRQVGRQAVAHVSEGRGHRDDTAIRREQMLVR